MRTGASERVDLEELLSRAAAAPEPWATDVRDLVALVRSLNGELARVRAMLDRRRVPL